MALSFSQLKLLASGLKNVNDMRNKRTFFTNLRLFLNVSENAEV